MRARSVADARRAAMPSARAAIRHAQNKKMGWLRGLEPPTSGITIQDSNQLSYSHHWNLYRIPERDPDLPPTPCWTPAIRYPAHDDSVLDHHAAPAGPAWPARQYPHPQPP